MTSRDKKQQEIVDAFVSAEGKGFVQACTGFGKTKIGLMIIQLGMRRHPGMTIVVGVPTLLLKDQWEKLLIEHNLQFNTKVYVYNTLCTLKLQCNLLICDEVHRTAAATFIELFEGVKHNWLLGLSATLERLDERHSLFIDRAPVLCNITLAQARKEGWVSNFTEYAVAVPLTELEQRQWTALSESYNTHAKHFGMSFGLAMACLRDADARREHSRTRGWHAYMGDDDYRSPKMQFIFAKQLIIKVQEQKRFITKHMGKEDAARKIVMRLKKKTLIFGEVISVAQDLNIRFKSFKVKSAAYHSKMNKKTREQVLADALSGKIDIICSAKALNEGFDFPAAELGVSVSRNKSKTVYIQQLGRVVRKHGDKESMFIHLYLPGTKDQRYLEQATKGSVGIQWVSLDEFNSAIGQVE